MSYSLHTPRDVCTCFTISSYLQDVSSHDESLVGGTFADADIRDRYTLDISELEQSFTSSAESVNSFTYVVPKLSKIPPFMW